MCMIMEIFGINGGYVPMTENPKIHSSVIIRTITQKVK